MSHVEPIPIASTSRTPAAPMATSNPTAGMSLYGSLSRLSLGMSPGMSASAFKAMISSSIEMEHGSLIRTLRGQNAGLLSEEMCRDYTCCGIPLKDLHALVDHFEEAHVVVVDRVNPSNVVSTPCYSAGGFDFGDDMDLDQPEPVVASASASSAIPSFGNQSVLVHRGAPWNPSPTVGYTPYPHREAMRRYQSYSTDPSECVVPELLFSPSNTPSPSGSRDGSPEPATGHSRYSQDEDEYAAAMSGHAPHRAVHTRAAGMVHATDLPPPRPKPFRCPKPGCNKAYKQANGLKYHLTHGQCNFAPLDPNSDELKPYICQAGCGKRFKNMSGLRYHYLHSTHGEVGLSLLDAGTHP